MGTEHNPVIKSSDHGISSSNNVSWSSEASWVIASGSLENSITFDSSDDSPVESDSPGKSTPLILKPPSPVSGPCEIKLYFSRKYTIRQIYVRSTARIYEIYHSQSQHSENEYLCTARCCIAERDDGVLQAQFYAESFKDTAGELTVDKFNGEDDWVDVEVVDSLLCENRSLSLLNKTNCNIEGFVQDYYEATVEISDLEPSALITIRFLSLQNKECVFLDEIYVFAELVDPIHSENLAPSLTGSAGSSLVAMLFPTLLQLSKSGTNVIQNEQASDKLGKVNKVEILSKATELTDVAPQIPQDEQSEADQQYVNLQDSEKLGKVNEVEILSEVTDSTDAVTEISRDEKSNADNQFVKLQNLDNTTESANTQLQNQNVAENRSPNPLVICKSPYGHIEEVLEQLVSRVSKIEEACLRFEENMLKPINRMETRIQRVEEQLESLVQNPHYSGLPTGTRIIAPSFSRDSNSSSIHNDGSDSQSFSRQPELDKKEFTSGALSNPYEGMPDLVKAPRFLPSLVVTAPEFSCVEDEQDDDGSEPLKGNNQDADVYNLVKDSPEGKPKLRSIDDVLAAALSNFLLSPSDDPLECKQTSVSDYDAGQVIGNETSSQNIKTLPSSSHEVTAGVSAYAEPPKYTQILTVTAPEFTSEETGGDEDLDFVQLPSEAASTRARRSDENSQVPPSPFVNGLFPVTSELSHCVANKSAYDQVVVTNDLTPNISYPAKEDLYSLETDVKNQFFEDSTTIGSLLVRSASFVADQAKDSVTDFCKTVEEAGQSDSSILLSPRKKDVMWQNFGYITDACSNTIKAAAVAEEPDEEVFSNLVESQSASLDDFSLPLVDVKFTSHENFSTQSSLEALLGDLPLPEGLDEIVLSNVFESQSASLDDFSLPLVDVKFTSHENFSTQSSLEALWGDLPLPEGLDEIVFSNVFESQTASLDDFSLPLVDVQFTSHENFSTQSSLEALWGDLPLPKKLKANSPRTSCGDFDSEPEESNFIDVDGNEIIDPVSSKRLLVDLGIYDIVGSSDEETGLDNHISISNHEMVANLV